MTVERSRSHDDIQAILERPELGRDGFPSVSTHDDSVALTGRSSSRDLQEVLHLFREAPGQLPIFANPIFARARDDQRQREAGHASLARFYGVHSERRVQSKFVDAVQESDD